MAPRRQTRRRRVRRDVRMAVIAKGHSYFVASWGITDLTLTVGIAGIITLFIIAATTIGDPLLPTLSSESIRFSIMTCIGIVLSLAGRALYKALMKNPKIALLERDKNYKVYYTVGGIVGFWVLSIYTQYLVILSSELIPQVTAPQVVAFFAFAGVAEEFVFRLGVISIIQTLFAYMFRKTGPKKTVAIIASVPAVIISGLVHLAAHFNYYDDPIAMITTLISGLYFAISYVLTRNTLVPVMVHCLLNLSVVNYTLQQIFPVASIALQAISLAISLVM